MSMLNIGQSEQALKAATDAVVAVLGASHTEAAQVAACNALAKIARSPRHVTISDCTFTSSEPVAATVAHTIRARGKTR